MKKHMRLHFTAKSYSHLVTRLHAARCANRTHREHQHNRSLKRLLIFVVLPQSTCVPSCMRLTLCDRVKCLTGFKYLDWPPSPRTSNSHSCPFNRQCLQRTPSETMRLNFCMGHQLPSKMRQRRANIKSGHSVYYGLSIVLCFCNLQPFPNCPSGIKLLLCARIHLLQKWLCAACSVQDIIMS